MSVRLGILSLLAEAPSHGYQLKADFEARTGGVWTINVGQVYTILDRLQKDGLAEPADRDADGDRRPWAITEQGRAVVERWLTEATVSPAPPRDEMLIKVLVAVGRAPEVALAVIDHQRTALFRLLQEARRATPGSADLAERLMAEAVRARHEADLAWLDRCEALVTSSPTPPSDSRTEDPR